MSLFPKDIFDLATEIRETARQFPNRVAVIEPNGKQHGRRAYKRFTYAELSADVEAVAVGLREMGIHEGTRTVFMAPPSYQACVMGAALTRVGAMLIWIDPSVGYRNVAERLGRVEPEAFVGLPIVHVGRLVFGWGSRLLRKLIVLNGVFPGARTIASLRRTAPKEPSSPSVTRDDAATILYTTGSTGPAKPAVYLHRNFCNVYRTAQYSWRFHADDTLPVDLAAFPAFLFIALSAGGTVVVPPIDFVRQGPADVDPQAIIEVINDCGVRSFFASPALLERMANHATAKRLTMPSLIRVIGGGAPLFAPLMRSLLPVMGEDAEVWSNYGATEALPSTEIGAAEVLASTAQGTDEGLGICVGRPFPGITARVVRLSDEPIDSLEDLEELPRGEVGELIVQGPNISPHYYQDELSTRKNKIVDAAGGVWHRLGDAGHMDAEGRLWVAGRLGQRVQTSEGPLFPLHIEPIFDAHPLVYRSGLVASGAAKRAHPVICVEPTRTLSASERDQLHDELLAMAATHLSTRAVKDLLFSAGLPVDPRHNAKIERNSLAKWAAAQPARRA